MTWSATIAKHQWPKAFTAPAPGAGVSQWEDGACAMFPGLKSSLLATPQDPVHHAEGDVWTHTVMVVDALLSDPAYAALTAPEQSVVFYAALLHDIDKPSTTRQDGDRIIAPGHSAKGAITTRIRLWEQGVPFALREQVCRLIEVHQVPFFAFDNRRGLPAEYTARHLSCDRSLKLLCMLARADINGRICHDQEKILDDIALFEVLAADLGCLDAPYPFPDGLTRMAYLNSSGGRDADTPVFAGDDFRVTMASGLPASGKSTWAKTQGLPVVSYDDLRAQMGLRHGQSTGAIVHAATDLMRTHLRQRQPFVINATHLSRQMRQKTLGLLRSYGASVHVEYFEADLQQILSRNAARDSTLTSKKLLSMLHHWEVPGLDEAESRNVRLAPPGPGRKPGP